MKRHVFLLKSQIARQGGLEKHAWRIARGFAEKGFPLTILTTGTVPTPSPLSVITHPISSKLSFRKIKEFDRFCHSFPMKGAIIFGMDRNRFQTHLRAGNGVHAAFLKIRRLIDSPLKRWTAPFNPLNQTILRLEKEAFEHKNLEILFTNSHMVQKEILEFYKTDRAKIRVVHNGVEWKEMESDFENWIDQKKKWTTALKLDPSRFHFLFIGHGFKRKGLEKLLHAFTKLSSDAHLSVVGHDRRINDFMLLRDQLGLTQQVRFFGAQKEVRPFYQFSDALVIPSFYDPFANVTVEALAMGLFVVSSKHNGGHEILTHTNGAIIDSLQDIDAITAALQEAMRHPKTWLLSQKIRSSVSYLDFSNQLHQYIAPCLDTLFSTS